MPKGSSPAEGTTISTYTDPGADTREGYAISSRSRALARSLVGDSGPEDRIRQRCSVAVGDFAMAGLMRFCHDPVGQGIQALTGNAPVVTDIRMVKVGILKKGHDSEVICALDHGEALSRETGITRTSAGFRSLRDRIGGSIVVIGTAPSSLMAVCEEGFRPSLVVGTPVGFVNAAESKERLRRLDVPSISTEGTRGGTPVAVASMNEIIVMYGEAVRARGSGDRVQVP
jgi:precorrin-8X/cobalt-precorrin-8 methylmutase